MRRVVIALGVLAVLGGVAGWWFWPRAHQNVDPRQDSGRVQDTRTTAGASVPPAVLTLLVNEGTGADIRAGEPLIFSVSLAGASGKRAFRVGAPGRAWSADLRFETPDGRSLPMKIEQLGSPHVYPTRRDSRAPAPAASEQAEGIEVDESRIHFVDLGLSPEESARVAAGSYDVRVVLPLPSAPEGVKLLASNTVRVGIAPAAPAAEQERRRLEAEARFYLEAEKWQDAHRIGLLLIQRQDADTTAFLLFGDSLNGLRRDQEAIAAYQEALAALPKDLEESPDYLFARMEQVQQRLEASAGVVKKGQ